MRFLSILLCIFTGLSASAHPTYKDEILSAIAPFKVTTDNLRKKLIKALVERKLQVPLSSLTSSQVRAADIAGADVLTSTDGVSISHSNEPDLQVPIEYILDELQMRSQVQYRFITDPRMRDQFRRIPYINTEVSEALLNLLNDVMPYQGIPQRLADLPESVISAGIHFIAFTALSANDGFRIKITNYIVYGKQRLRMRSMLAKWLLEDVIRDFESKTPKLVRRPHIVQWLDSVLIDFRNVEKEGLLELDPDEILKTLHEKMRTLALKQKINLCELRLE